MVAIDAVTADRTGHDALTLLLRERAEGYRLFGRHLWLRYLPHAARALRLSSGSCSADVGGADSQA